MYFLYILINAGRNRTYTGVTKNVSQRLREHNAGKVKSSRPYRPYTIFHTESFLTLPEALEKEKFYKSTTGRRRIKEFFHIPPTKAPMKYSEDFNNNRQFPRIIVSLPILLKIDAQITLTGQIKDLSIKSAFVRIKSSVHMAVNDEFYFTIQTTTTPDGPVIEGKAHISRIVKEEGIGIYFESMDDASAKRLKEFVEARM